MLGVNAAFKDAGRIEFLRFMTKQHDDLSPGIQARVVVVVVLGRRNPVSGEDHPALSGRTSGETERCKALAQLQFGPNAVYRVGSMIPGADRRFHRYWKRLQV